MKLDCCGSSGIFPDTWLSGQMSRLLLLKETERGGPKAWF